jgi:hypothetical protein
MMLCHPNQPDGHFGITPRPFLLRLAGGIDGKRLPPLVTGDRDQRHFAKSDIERLEVGTVLSAVKSSQLPSAQSGK